jgi:hypothetical protein
MDIIVSLKVPKEILVGKFVLNFGRTDLTNTMPPSAYDAVARQHDRSVPVGYATDPLQYFLKNHITKLLVYEFAELLLKPGELAALLNELVAILDL